MQQMITNPTIVTWKILNLDGRAPCTIMLTAEIIIRQNDVFKDPENYVFPIPGFYYKENAMMTLIKFN